jgi:hypothetical protein
MTQLRHQIVWLLGVTIVAVVSAGAVARAQNDGEREEGVEASRPEDRQKFVAELQRLRLQRAYKAQFDRWFAFQFRPRIGARNQLELRLAGRIRELDADCYLTAAQVKKLELAGRGDIKRFMDRVDNIRRTLEDPRSSVEDLRAARLGMIELDANAIKRLFGDDSLLCKTLAGMLDPEQVAAREKAIFGRNVIRHRTAVAAATTAIQANLDMNDEQCKRFAELLLRETRAPRRFGTAPDVALVLFQASRIPEERIRPIFDDAQWRILSRWMAIYIRGASGERTLMTNGFVFDDLPAVVSRKDDLRDAERNHRD